jgi:hypothetical protein
MFLFLLWIYMNKDKQGRKLKSPEAVLTSTAQPFPSLSPAPHPLENR